MIAKPPVMPGAFCASVFLLPTHNGTGCFLPSHSHRVAHVFPRMRSVFLRRKRPGTAFARRSPVLLRRAGIAAKQHGSQVEIFLNFAVKKL